MNEEISFKEYRTSDFGEKIAVFKYNQPTYEYERGGPFLIEETVFTYDSLVNRNENLKMNDRDNSVTQRVLDNWPTI